MKKILLGILVVLSLIMWAGLVWFAFPLVGFGDARPFQPLWVRILLIVLVWLTVGIVYLVKFLRRRKAEKALEAAISEPAITGDGEVLSEKMSEALSVLKSSSGGKSYLYDLPWYVIIGPPGSGKTTALLNSGIKFPLAEKGGGAIAGVGGTRYCDWWFSEEAVLIDTAGRYTTQDSDAEADRESWLSFLKLLKTHRENQPINGVIVSISIQEVLTGTPAELEAHSDTIRRRLMEIHEELKVDFPVYVLFTKADLIAGFMEYFGSFAASRRQKVWGHTFQTESKKEQTVDRFGVEYDALVSRLGDEVIDRLAEEPDGVNRIAIFGFPGQVAMLKDKLERFMEGVFAHTRYKVNANLRGFYFSSGTQEGTPIDSVLGAMERNFGNIDASAGMSGQGRSYFLHDLLRKVIFAEAGWVSTDRKAVRRKKIMRYGAFAAICLGAMGVIGLWGTSFMQNRELIRTAEAAISDYELAAQDELQRSELASFDLQEIVGYLGLIRNVPLGYGDSDVDGDLTEKFGLSQRDRMSAAAITTYRQALERMMRSRLLLRVEAELESRIRGGDVMPVYEALKVYKLLGDYEGVPASDDPFVIEWFSADWRNNQYPGPAFIGTRSALQEHLAAMLELDDTARSASYQLNGSLIEQAERMLARMEVSDQAYALILANVEVAGIEAFDVALRAGRDAELVFETKDGTPLEELRISPLFTRAGFHQYFLPQLFEMGDTLATEQWVLGTYADTAKIEEQLAALGPVLVDRYTEDWINAWDGMLGNLKARPMSADKPNYQTLAAAGAPRSSPFTLLAEQVVQETSLTADLSGGGAGGDLAQEIGGNIGQSLIAQQIGRLSGGSLIIARSIFGGAKGEFRAGGGAPPPLPGSQIENYYVDWQVVTDGDPGQRPLDAMTALFRDLRLNLVIAVDNRSEVDSQLKVLTGTLSAEAGKMPTPYDTMLLAMARDFRDDTVTVELQSIRDTLNQDVTAVCEQVVTNNFPFSRNGSRDVSITEFSRLFSPRGVIDTFFLENLAEHVNTSGEVWTWNQDAFGGTELSQETLRNFQRAAEIRDAFFFGGGVPMVSMTITPTSIHNQVRNAVLSMNGQVITTGRRGNQPMTLNWPSTAGGGTVSLQFTPSLMNRDSQLALQGGWSFLRFLMAGQPKLAGSSIQVRYVLGGRDISYRIDVAAEENPFFMRALSEFKCPRGL